MGLKEEIRNWDGKTAGDILAIYHEHVCHRDFSHDLIAALSEPPLQNGASWLLKEYLSNKNQLEATTIARVYHLLPLFDHWESKLHILQCMKFMPIPIDLKNELHQFLRLCLKDQNKLIRAWGYNGINVIATHFPEFESERDELLEKARENEAASVKARIRNILKEKN